MNAKQILSEAFTLMSGDRQESYGDPTANHDRIAAIWSIILGVPVSAEQVALCMAGMKLARLAYDPTHLDSYIDGAAYMAIAGEIASNDK